MERDTKIFQDELSREVTVDGVKLIVCAMKAKEGQWQLSIQNEFGISSNWVEFFSTAQQAIDAGIMAIETEGLGPFVETDGFEYLFDKNV